MKLSTSALPNKRQDFWGKKVFEQKAVLIFSTIFVSNFLFSFSEELREISLKMYIGLHAIYPLCLSHFNEIWIFSTNFRKIPKYKLSWKPVHCEPSCSLRTDGQTERRTDAMKIKVAFGNFPNAPEIILYIELRFKKTPAFPSTANRPILVYVAWETGNVEGDCSSHPVLMMRMM